MVAKVDKIAAEIQQAEAERLALVEQAAIVEKALAQPGADPALAVEHVTLGARIKAAALRALELAQRKQDAEQAALLSTYRQRLGELYAIEGELGALDAEIQAHQDAIARLNEARQPLESQRQLASGRLARLHQNARAAGLGGEAMAMRADMDRANRHDQQVKLIS